MECNSIDECKNIIAEKEAEIQVLKEQNKINEITHRQLDDELKKEKILAESANIAKSEFLGNMSHELRTPFNAILGFSEILLEESFGPLNEKQKEYLKNIYNSSKQLYELISSILELSQIEVGEIRLELQMYLLREIIAASFRLQKEKAMKHKIELKLELAPEADIEVQIDQKKVKQVLYHLINNAIKFSPQGGNVVVKAKKEDNNILISVIDRGIGIKQEDLPKMFEGFVQLEPTLSKKYQGIGIGLTLAQKMIELHGGKIWATSEGPGKGSCFTFSLPIILRE